MVHTRAYLNDLSSHFAEPLDHEPWPDAASLKAATLNFDRLAGQS